jgi:hypothetical protein
MINGRNWEACSDERRKTLGRTENETEGESGNGGDIGLPRNIAAGRGDCGTGLVRG